MRKKEKNLNKSPSKDLHEFFVKNKSVVQKKLLMLKNIQK